MAGTHTILLRCAAGLFLTLLTGCAFSGAARADPVQAAEFTRRLNDRTAQITTSHGRYGAVSVLVEAGRPPHLVLRTRLTGDARDEIGLAAAAFYGAARTLAREMDLPCEINGDFASAAMVWNGREVSCDLLTVRF
jgi:hypothetical protein